MELELLQSLKTGALISAAAELGCIAAGGSRRSSGATRARDYAQALGRAFQIQDDMLDVTRHRPRSWASRWARTGPTRRAPSSPPWGWRGAGALVERADRRRQWPHWTDLQQPDFLIWLAREPGLTGRK